MQNMIKVSQGLLEGVSCDGYVVFKGVPYAKPPVGELRWKAPESIEGWEGILQGRSLFQYRISGASCERSSVYGKILQRILQ